MGDSRQAWLVPCALTAVAIIYGAWQLIAKAAMSEGTSPYVFTFYRSFGGMVTMFWTLSIIPELRANPKKPFYPLTEIRIAIKTDGWRFIILGCCMTLNMGGAILAVSRLSAVTCALLQPAVPMVAAIMSIILGVEKFSVPNVCTLMICAVGAIMVVLSGTTASSGQSHISLTGFTFLCINIFGAASYTVMQKHTGVLKSYSPIFVAGMAFLVAAYILWLPAVYSSGLSRSSWSMGDDKIAFGALCYAVILTTAFNYSALAWANKISSPSSVLGFQTLQPVATSLLSYLVLGTLLTTGQALGGCLIIAGLLLNVLFAPKSKTKEEALRQKDLLPKTGKNCL